MLYDNEDCDRWPPEEAINKGEIVYINNSFYLQWKGGDNCTRRWLCRIQSITILHKIYPDITIDEKLFKPPFSSSGDTKK